MARSQVRQSIKRIRRQLSSAQRSEFAVLADAIDDEATTLTLEEDLPKSIVPGALLNIDLEVMRVRTIDTTAKTCVVRRGWGDSIAVAHQDDDEIAINPRYSMLDIYEAMVDELTSWGPGIYRVESETFSFATDAQTIELPAEWSDMYQILGVAAHRTDAWLGEAAGTKWPGVGGWSLLTTSVGTIDQALTSGRLLRLQDPWLVGTVVVTIAGPLLAFDMSLGADIVEDVGCPASALDLMDAGVKLRLSVDGEHGRSGRTVQGDSRDAAETPMGSTVPFLNLLQQKYQRRMSEEVFKLHNQYPWRMS